MTWLPAYSFCLLPILLILRVDALCKINDCIADFEETLAEKNIARDSSKEYCQVLLDYWTCLKTTSRACRGDIMYLSSFTAVRKLYENNNCSAYNVNKIDPETPRPRPSKIPPLPLDDIAPYTPPPSHSCTFRGRGRYKYCGLFGDPHLKTFSNEYQTCRIIGTWSLIDNPYLAITVSNGQVVDDLPATVTTVATVLIKGQDTSCTTEKTYEATSDQPLSDTFVDGTRHSENIVLTLRDIDDDHQSVEIHLKYIKTTIIVRQVGKYLAFAVQLPEELVELESQKAGLLCGSGCPKSERLDLVKSHGTALSWEEALVLCRDSSDLANEINNNLTDHYLDWCVFDVMTTGVSEAKAFTAAAHSAQADALRFEPHELENRTEPKLRPRPFSSATAPMSSVFTWLVVMAAVTWSFPRSSL